VIERYPEVFRRFGENLPCPDVVEVVELLSEDEAVVLGLDVDGKAWSRNRHCHQFQ
jgi:hypothetical protein